MVDMPQNQIKPKPEIVLKKFRLNWMIKEKIVRKGI